MLKFLSNNEYYGIKYYFSADNFIKYLNEKYEIFVCYQSNNTMYKIFKCKNFYILPYDYSVYGIYYIISTDIKSIELWLNEYCL